MKKLPLYFNSIATLPDKNCAVNISISYITLQNSRENLCKPATQKNQVKYEHCDMWCAFNNRAVHKHPLEAFYAITQ